MLATNLLLAQNSDDTGISRPFVPPAITPEEDPISDGPTQDSSQMAPLRTPIHTAAPDMGMAYGTWATGDDYKVSFHDGMTFIPYLGADYPKTQSLGWSTKSVTLGATEMLGGMTKQGAQGAWRYEYQFGAVTEAYDVRNEGLEQTFVLRAKPAIGDLVIRGTVATQLHSNEAAAAHQALTFQDKDGRVILQYGTAIAFDANGNRVDVATSYTNGEITLTVPGQWMEQAVLPITVDPLLANVAISSGTAAVRSLDLGRDDKATSYNIMVTYTRAISATDSDLWVRLRDEDFVQSSLVYSDITSNWSTDQTSCAFVGGTDRWAVVMRRYFMNSAIHTSRLRCHMHDSGNIAFETNVGALNPTIGLNDWRADTGGVQAYATGDDAFVVFQREDNSATGNHFSNAVYSKVYGCHLDTTTANGTFGAPFEIKPTNIHDCERPSVNQMARGGANFSWVCVSQRFVEGQINEDWDLSGSRISNTGTIANGNWSSDMAAVSPKQHQLGPKVEGAYGRYAVVFATVDVASVNLKTSLITGKQLRIERFDWDHALSSPTGNYDTETIRSTTDRRWEATGIGFDTNDRSHWVCVFRSAPPGTGYLYFSRVGFNGVGTEGLAGTSIYTVAGDVAFAGACVFDDDNDEFLLSYAVDEAGQWNTIYGQTLTYDTPNAPYTFGVSCSSATLSWIGNQQIGAEFNHVQVTGAPPFSIHIMLAATTTANISVINPVVFPGCKLLVMAAGPGYLGAFPTAVGSNPNWQLSLPEFLGAQTLHFQDWYLDANGLLYSTERLSVPIIK